MKKKKNIYIFLGTLCLISAISGYKYYDFQSTEDKETIKESIDLNSSLNKRTNNIFKTIKNIFIILLCSLLIITNIISITKIFYDTFSIAFVFHLLESFNLKLTFIFNLIYYIIPLIFLIWLVRISFTISKSIINYLIKRNDNNKKHIILLLKKYLLISSLLIIYQILIYIFSSSINAYLISLL